MRLKKDGYVSCGKHGYKEPDKKLEQELKAEAERLRTILVDEEYISPYDEALAFARMLTIARKQLGLSLEESHIALEMPLRRYTLLEAGEKLPSKAEVSRICAKWGIDPILANKLREKAALAARRICVMGHSKENIAITRNARFSVQVPWKVREWLDTEAQMRNIPMSGFVSLLICTRYRIAMRELYDPDNEAEKEFEIINDIPTVDTGILLYEEDESKVKEFISDPDSDYEWGNEPLEPEL